MTRNKCLPLKKSFKFLLVLYFSLMLNHLAFAGTNGKLQSKIAAILDSSSDYMVYYGTFDANKVLQAQYFKLVIVDISGITPEQVDDIKNGFDNIPGTNDDVIVLGYLSIGEQDGATITGDGTGPVYWDGSKVVHEYKGYASFYLDDKDRNGKPDEDGTWSSWYVNAGDTAWWNYNNPQVQNIITIHHCDGLFLDMVDVAGPNPWGLPYQWTSPGMINYIEHLRQIFPDKYILANRGLFYFDPSIPNEYQYADRYRKAINGLMIESYYSTWDWNKSIGVYNTSFPQLRDYFAPLINDQAHKPDGFNVFILDYMSQWQSNHDALLDTVVKVSERDQGWLVSVSPILLDSIWFDVYNHHLTDNNPPSWAKIVGINKYKWDGNNLDIYFDEAKDQTPPVHYNVYLSENNIDFSSPPHYKDITPQPSDVSDYMYVIPGLDPTKTYYAAVRAYDSCNPVHMDPDRKVLEVVSGATPGIKIDGYFDDWGSWNRIDSLVNDTLVPPSCDLREVWFSEDNDNFYFSFSTADSIKNPPYYYHIFIDDDNNPTTGYHPDSSYIGADLMCENGYLWKYNGTQGEWSWNYVGQVDYQIGITNKNQVELAIPKNSIPGNLSSISFIYQIDNQIDTVANDYAPHDYKVNEYHSSDYVESVKNNKTLPIGFKMNCRTYPNPFNPTVTFLVNFNKPVSDNLRIKIYDIMGQLVFDNIIPDYQETTLKYIWNATNSSNQKLSSGIYLYQIEAINEKLQVTGKIVYLK